MKNKKIYLFVFFITLSFSFIFNVNNAIFNLQGNDEDKNIIPLLSSSDSVEFEWYATWGGSLSEGSGLVTTDSSGNIYVGGSTKIGTGNTDMVLIKYDSSGMELWSRTLDGNQNDDLISGIVLDPTGDNIYIAGTTAVIPGLDNDMVLVKYDSSGIELWSRTWDGYNDWDCQWRPGIDDDRVNQIVVDASGNIYLAGNTLAEHIPRWDANPDMALVKYDSSGTQLWNRTWGGDLIEYGGGLALDASENVYITGSTVSFAVGSTDIFLVKYRTLLLPISAIVDIDPNTLNLKSNGQYITAFIELSGGHDVNNIDLGSIRLIFETYEILIDIEAPGTIGDYDSDGIPDLMVRFSRIEVITLLETPDYDLGTVDVNNIEFVVTGDIVDHLFEGSDWIKVIRPHVREIRTI